MKPTVISSTYTVILTITSSSFFVPTNVLVQASTVSKVWKKINFFTSSNGSMINETLSIMDEIQPSPIVQQEIVCPTLKSDVICSTDWDPYICGTNQCEYSNDCVAQGSGFNVTAECRKSSEPSTEVPDTEDAFACPTQVNPDLFCTEQWDPYICGENNCQYGNDCEALVAGFNVTTNCTRVATTEPTTVQLDDDCPALPTDLFCEEIWKPYLCVDKCSYPNDCYASASGFNVTTDCIELPV